MHNWIDIKTNGGGIAPSNVIEPKIKIGNGKVTIFWSDPKDTIVDGQPLCTWKGTKLVQKVGDYPENMKDGKVLVDNQANRLIGIPQPYKIMTVKIDFSNSNPATCITYTGV